MRLELRGSVFSGIGKGKYYVGQPEYQERFESTLGYRPYPGTLNVKLEDTDVVETMRSIRSKGGLRVDGFTRAGEVFSGLLCFNGELKGEKITLLFIDITYYNESVAELISPVYLRGRFGIKDGDQVAFTMDFPDSVKR